MHLNRKYVIPLIILSLILTWLLSSLSNVNKAKNREGIVLSPDKSKSVEFIEAIGTSQLMMNYHKSLFVGGSNIVSGNFNENEMRIKWLNEDSLLIEYPESVQLRNQESELYFFGEITKVIYKKNDRN